MFLEICSEEESIVIEVSGREVGLPGRDVAIDWVRLPDGTYSILAGGSVYDLSVDLDRDSFTVSGRRGRFTFRVRDPRRLEDSGAVEQGQSGLQRLLAEMPGKVIRVHVKEGDAVARDQGLLVLEAMKMQNEIRAPKAGTIRAVGVTAGKTVKSGDFLLSLE